MGRGPKYLADWKADYQRKFRTVEELAQLIESHTVVFSHGWISEPFTLMRAIQKRVGELEDVEWHVNNTFEPYYDDTEEHIRYVHWGVSDAARKNVQNGIGSYVPSHFYQVAARDTRDLDIDYALITVSPPDENGFMTFGVAVSHIRSIVDNAKIVIAQVNPNAPRVCGNSRIHISEIDYICEAEEPLLELPYVAPDKNAEQIASYISEYIENGSTIQLGIGKIPNAVASFLKDKRDLGVHSEMFTDSMMELMELGVITNARKSIDKYKAVATFTGGSKKLYKWVDNNPFVEFHPVSYVNNANVIAQQHKLVSINASLSIDLTGQCCSESIGLRQHSGTGGQVDFNIGAGMNPESKAFIAVNSTANTKNGRVSTIVPFHPGSFVTTSRNDVEYIVTEYGVARMRGKSIKQRVEQLINIAHPDYRDELRFEAKKLHFI